MICPENTILPRGERGPAERASTRRRLRTPTRYAIPMDIGLIGVGLLGSSLATRLLASGFRVIGYDVNPANRLALRQMGGHAVDSAPEVASGCGRILLR